MSHIKTSKDKAGGAKLKLHTAKVIQIGYYKDYLTLRNLGGITLQSPVKKAPSWVSFPKGKELFCLRAGDGLNHLLDCLTLGY